MKIKIEMDMPRWLSRAILVGIPVAIVAIAAWVFADVPNSFKTGDTVSAQKMMDNFAAVASPPGTVVAFAGANMPSGWLLCDGSAVSRTTFASLLLAIGTAHGGGDGLTTFNLPDYRGRFLRGVDGTAGRDLDSGDRKAPQEGVSTVTGGPGNAANSVGSVQDDAFASHNHPFGVYQVSMVGPGTALAEGRTDNGGYNQRIGTNPIQVQLSGGSETRSKNSYVNYIIKY